jgi:hypothetical protein
VVLDVALAPAVTAEGALDIGLLAVGVLVGGRVELGCGDAVRRRSRAAAVDAALAPGSAEDADASPAAFEKRTLAPMATATSPTMAPATAERLTRTTTSLPKRRHLGPKPIVSRRHPRAAGTAHLRPPFEGSRDARSATRSVSTLAGQAGTASRPPSVQCGQPPLVERVDHIPDGVLVGGHRPGDRRYRRPGRRGHHDQRAAHPERPVLAAPHHLPQSAPLVLRQASSTDRFSHRWPRGGFEKLLPRQAFPDESGCVVGGGDDATGGGHHLVLLAALGRPCSILSAPVLQLRQENLRLMGSLMPCDAQPLAGHARPGLCVRVCDGAHEHEPHTSLEGAAASTTTGAAGRVPDEDAPLSSGMAASNR